MKIGIFTDVYRPKLDGVAVFMENAVNQLIERQVEYELYAPYTPGEYKDQPNVFRFRSIPFFAQPEVRLSIPIDRKNLQRALTSDYDVVYSQGPGPLGMLAFNISKVRRIPHFHTFHTFYPDYTHYIFGGRVVNPKMVTQLSRLWANRMDYLTVPTEKIQIWLKEIGVHQPIRVIPNGVDIQRFQPQTEKTTGSILVDRGWVSPQERVCLFVGRVGQEKSIDQLIRFFAKIPDVQTRRMKLVIVGDGPEKANMMQLARELGVDDLVVFTGYISPEQMPEVYQAAWLFTFLSTSETQGIVVVEAIASGLPAILAKDDAYQSMLVKGQNGFMVSTEAEFVQAIMQLADNEEQYQEFSSQSIKIAQQFDISAVIERLLQYFQEGVEQWQPKRLRFLPDKLHMAELQTQLKSTYNELRERILKDV